MAKMPALVEETERISKDGNSANSDSKRIECLKQNWDIHTQLEDWYHELSKRSTEPLYKERPASKFCGKMSAELENMFSISLYFSTFEIARINLFYWAALLWIHNNISILQPSEATLLSRSLKIATRIAQSMEYLLSPEMHTRGPQNVFHPLRLAQQVFSMKDAESKEVEGREVRWCRDIFEEVYWRGYPFGKILSSWKWEDIPVLLSRGEST